MPFRSATRMRSFGVALLLVGAWSPARAQDASDPSVLPPGLGLEHGALLFHGNYCGPGNRAPLPPIDALDLACLHHDACTPDLAAGRIAACACNARLRTEANRVARDPRQPDDLRALADVVADGADLLPCRSGRVTRGPAF